MSLERGGGTRPRGGRGNNSHGRGAPAGINNTRGGGNNRGTFRSGSNTRNKESSPASGLDGADEVAARRKKFAMGSPQGTTQDWDARFDQVSSRNATPNKLVLMFQKLKKERDRERADAIKRGLLADPEKPTTLANAIVPVGTCKDMCPDLERVQRVVQLDLWDEETDHTKGVDAQGRAQPVEGKMVKKFKRAAAGNEEQLPSDLRPPPVLKATCDYLFEEFLPSLPFAMAHNFVWDRTRAVRNDFSIQQVTAPEDVRLAVECFERITRFHIHALHELATAEPAHAKYDRKGELQMLDKTLLSLMQYYDDFRHIVNFSHEAEFRAYYIILQIQNPTLGIGEKAQTWDQHMLQHPRVKTALDIWARGQNSQEGKGPMNPYDAPIFAREDYAGFWATVAGQQTSYLEACLAECYFNHMRYLVLKNLVEPTSRRGAVIQGVGDPTEEVLRELLAFSTKADLEEYLNDAGIELVHKGGVDCIDSTLLKRSGALNKLPALPLLKTRWVDAKRAGRTATAVINGVKVVKAQETGQVEETSEAPTNEEDMDDGESLFMPKAKPTAATNKYTKPAVNGFGALSDDSKRSTSPFGKPNAEQSNPFGGPASKPAFSFGQPSDGQKAPSPTAAPAFQGPSFGKPSGGGVSFGQPSKDENKNPFAGFSGQSTNASSGTFGKPSQSFSFAAGGATTNGTTSTFGQNGTSTAFGGSRPSSPGGGGGGFGSSPVNFASKPAAPAAGEASAPTFTFGQKPGSSGGGTPGSTSPAQSTNDSSSTPTFNFGQKQAPGGSGGFGSLLNNDTSNAMKPAAENSPSVFSFGQNSSPGTNNGDLNAAPHQPAGFGNFQLAPNKSTTEQKTTPQFNSAQPAGPQTTEEKGSGNSPFTFGQAAGNVSFTSTPSQVSNQAESQTAQSQSAPFSSNFSTSPTQPSTSQAPPPGQHTRPPSFSESKHQPKKPSPLSRSYTASEDSATPKQDPMQSAAMSPSLPKPAFTSQENMTQVSTEQTAMPPAVKKPDPDAVLSRVARELALDPTYGILQQWIENEISVVITAAQKQVGMERDNAAADEFRTRKLSTRFGIKWRGACWRSTLKKKGREMRQRKREQHLRTSQGSQVVGKPIEESPFSNSMARSTSGRSTRKRKLPEREEVDRDFQLSTNNLEQRAQQAREEEEELRKSRRPTSSHGPGQTTKPSASGHKRFKSTSHVDSGEAIKPGSMLASHEDMELRRSAFLRYRRTDAGSPKRETTSSYFRLKAMGIQPEMKLGYSSRKSTNGASSQRSNSSSRKRRRSETMSLTPEGTPIPSMETHTPLEPSSSPQSTSSNKVAKVEAGEDAFQARLRAAKEALSVSAEERTPPAVDSHSQELSASMRQIRESPTMDLVRKEAEKRASQDKIKHAPRYTARESRFLRPDPSVSRAFDRSRGFSRSRSWVGSRPGSRLEDNAVVSTEEFSPDRPALERQAALAPASKADGPDTQPQQKESPKHSQRAIPAPFSTFNTSSDPKGANDETQLQQKESPQNSQHSQQVNSAPLSAFGASGFGTGSIMGPSKGFGTGSATDFGAGSNMGFDKGSGAAFWSSFNNTQFSSGFSQAPAFSGGNTQQLQQPRSFNAFGTAAFAKPDTTQQDTPTQDEPAVPDSPSLRKADVVKESLNAPQRSASPYQPVSQIDFANAPSRSHKQFPAPAPIPQEESPQPISGFAAAQPAAFSQASTQPSFGFGFGFGARPAEVPETQDHTIQPTQISQSLRQSFGAPQRLDTVPNGTQHESPSQNEVIDLQDSAEEDEGGQAQDPALSKGQEHISRGPGESQEEARYNSMQGNPHPALVNQDEADGSEGEDVGLDLQGNLYAALADEGEEEDDLASEDRDEEDAQGYKSGFARALAGNAQTNSYINVDYDSVDEEDEALDEDEQYQRGDEDGYAGEEEDGTAEGERGFDDGLHYEDEDADEEDGSTEFDSQYDSEDEDVSENDGQDEVPAQRYAAPASRGTADRYGRLPPQPPKPEMGGSTEEDAIELSD
ncbi:hypothetical protein MBLNU230_g8020t1 [Neophaeotheca triangularis]